MIKSSISALLLSMALLCGSLWADDGLWDRISGNWEQFEGQAKERWGELTDDEWLQIEGKKDRLIGTIQEKYGIAEEAAEEQVDEWADALDS